LECALNLSVLEAHKTWCASACICLREALQIQALQNFNSLEEGVEALAWCKKSASKALKIFFYL
jgi:hypothetical protein